jgi:DNA-binding XRE family transcriptional regulator
MSAKKDANCLHIAEYRRRAGLTQRDVGERLGVSCQAVSKWEQGRSCPDVMLLPDIAHLFGVTIDALFGIDRGEE